MSKNIEKLAWNSSGSFWTTELFAKLGFKKIVFDCEHSAVTLSNLENNIRLSSALDMKPVLRIKDSLDPDIPRYLDMGVNELIVPRVEELDQILKIEKRILYPPEGNRGVGLYRAQMHGIDFENYISSFNENIKILAQVETQKGSDFIEQIINHPLINGIFIGPYDLSASLGFPGDFESEKFKLYFNKILSAAKQMPDDFSLGYHLVHFESEEFKKLIEYGFNYIAVSTDIQLFLENLKNLKKNLEE